MALILNQLSILVFVFNMMSSGTTDSRELGGFPDNLEVELESRIEFKRGLRIQKQANTTGKSIVSDVDLNAQLAQLDIASFQKLESWAKISRAIQQKTIQDVEAFNERRRQIIGLAFAGKLDVHSREFESKKRQLDKEKEQIWSACWQTLGEKDISEFRFELFQHRVYSIGLPEMLARYKTPDGKSMSAEQLAEFKKKAKKIQAELARKQHQLFRDAEKELVEALPPKLRSDFVGDIRKEYKYRDSWLFLFANHLVEFTQGK